MSDGKLAPQKGESQIKKLNDKIAKLQSRAKHLLTHIDKEIQKTKPRAVYIYIQFLSMNGKIKFLKEMNMSWLKRLWIRCRRRYNTIQHKYIGNRWPQINEIAPHPSQIQWENLGVTTIRQFFKSTIAYFVALLLLAVSFLVIIFCLDYKDSLTQNSWSSTECGSFIPTSEDAI